MPIFPNMDQLPFAPFDTPPTVLVNEEGQVMLLPNLSTGGHGTAPAPQPQPTPPPPVSGSPFQINITYDASVANAPAGFVSGITAVVQYLESQFTDNVTINISVGYGEVGGQALGAGALGESLTYLSSYTYSQIKNALVADAKSADDGQANATLPLNSPVAGTFWTSQAEAKALGLAGPSSSIDGYIGFSNSNLFDYDRSDGISPGLYDFFGVVVHEVTEVMGRSLLVGQQIGGATNGYYPLDLFHYSSQGVRLFTGASSGYFSLDGGATNLGNFNTNPFGDFGDWASSVGSDAFLAFGSPGVLAGVSQNDLREMDILGWDRASTGVAQPDLVATGLVLSGVSLTYHISNIGNGSATSSSSGVYLSTDATVTTSDTLLGTTAAGALAAGASDTETFTLSFPATLSPGTYYVAVLADYNNSVLESNEGNNASNTFPVIIGNGSGNSLNGTTSNDIMFGLAGDDVLDGGTGADSMYGGLGNDTYVIDSPGDVAVENFGEGTDLARSSVSYTLPANIENLTLLSASNINGTGNGLANVITGNAGDNVLSGAGGNDTLMGGLGADRFLFNSTLNGASNVDTVVDFSHAEGDIIGLDHTIFTALTAPQSSGAHSGFSTVQSPTIWASDFYASANGAAHLPTDHILYNTTTGVLAYDPDGNGAMPAIPFAVLPNLPNLVAADFWYL